MLTQAQYCLSPRWNRRSPTPSLISCPLRRTQVPQVLRGRCELPSSPQHRACQGCAHLFFLFLLEKQRLWEIVGVLSQLGSSTPIDLWHAKVRRTITQPVIRLYLALQSCCNYWRLSMPALFPQCPPLLLFPFPIRRCLCLPHSHYFPDLPSFLLFSLHLGSNEPTWSLSRPFPGWLWIICSGRWHHHTEESFGNQTWVNSNPDGWFACNDGLWFPPFRVAWISMGTDLVLAMTGDYLEVRIITIILCRKEVSKKVVCALIAPPDLNYSNSYWFIRLCHLSVWVSNVGC